MKRGEMAEKFALFLVGWPAGDGGELGDEMGLVVDGRLGGAATFAGARGGGWRKGFGQAELEGEAGRVKMFALVADGAGAIAGPAIVGLVAHVTGVGAGAAHGGGDSDVERIVRDIEGADAAFGVVGAAPGLVGGGEIVEPEGKIGLRVGRGGRLSGHGWTR